MRTLRLVYGGILGIALIQCIYFYPRLPAVMASHYNAQGVVNDWSSKPMLFGGYAAILGLQLAVFTLLPRLIRRLPNGLINIPNKDYWLSSERREQTLDGFARQMNWFGIAVLTLLVVVFQLVFSANLPGSTGFSTPLARILVGGFLLFTLAWTVRMLLVYRRPRK